MKKIKYKLPAYRIVGILHNGHDHHAAARSLERSIAMRVRDVVCLPFAVEQKYFKNLVACMKLMDVECLVVDPVHGKRIMRELNRLDARARAAGFVDTVVRAGTKFTGTCSWAQALIQLAGTKYSRPIIVVGSSKEASTAARVLKSCRPTRVRTLSRKRTQNLAPNTLIFDFTGSVGCIPRGMQCISPAALARAHRQVMVDTLVSSLQ